MYELLVVIHILSAIAWVGGAFLFMIGLRGIRKAEGDEVAEATMDRLERASAIITPTPFLLLGTGIAMVAVDDAWSFSQVWVYLALALFVVVLILGAGFAERFQKQIKQAREEGRPLADLLDRFLRVGSIEIFFFVVIVSLMVYKPI